MSQTIFVTGATGNVGRNVVTLLLSEGVRVRALSRNPDAARLPSEVEVVRGDLSSTEWLDGALDDIHALFLVCRVPPAAELIAAVSKRVKRIVFLSSSAIRDGVDPQPNFIGRMHLDIERSIANSATE